MANPCGSAVAGPCGESYGSPQSRLPVECSGPERSVLRDASADRRDPGPPAGPWTRNCAVAVVAAAGLSAAVAFAAPAAITVQTASPHPMRYHLALPAGWSVKREWPVVVVIPDAARE